MLTGTLITAAGFLPIGMAKFMTGEYTFAIFAVTVIAGAVSWLCLGCIWCPTWAAVPEGAARHGQQPGFAQTARGVR